MTSRVLVYNRSSIPNSSLSSSLGLNPNNWLTFDNKYFTVQVEVCFENRPPVEEISDTVEAFVYMIDPEPVKGESLTDLLGHVDVFEEMLEECSPEVKLLVVNCEETPLESELLEWCMERQFELIKYIAPGCEAGEEHQLMGQAEGVGRVLSALECHMWPYRTAKKATPPDHTQEDFGEYVSSPATQPPLPGVQGMMELDADGDFESMLGGMFKMKQIADQLPDGQRKDFAEQVAMSFWRAMGGSGSEDREGSGSEDGESDTQS